jgi:hypothetical protein
MINDSSKVLLTKDGRGGGILPHRIGNNIEGKAICNLSQVAPICVLVAHTVHSQKETRFSPRPQCPRDNGKGGGG